MNDRRQLTAIAQSNSQFRSKKKCHLCFIIRKISVLNRKNVTFTFSNWAFFLDLYKNSPTATKTESTKPAARTMKIPPIFWTPRALASLLSSSGQPLPRHHFSFIMCSLPSSCSWRIAMVILSRYGEPEEKEYTLTISRKDHEWRIEILQILRISIHFQQRKQHRKTQ